MSSIDEYVSFQKPLLPLEKMRALVAEKATAYKTAQPFPHIVIDDFFDPVILDRVLSEFPGEDGIDWQRYAAPKTEVKLASKSEQQIGLFTRYLIYSLNSAAFMNFLEQLTGISGLLPDPHLWGGGLHQIMPGGKLAVHTDFNRYEHMKLDRRLNVLLYLNRDWHDDWAGHLELWSRDMSACVQKVAPVFNRLVCFSTTDFSYHGHPDTLRCPPGRARRSLALYYYSNGRPAEEVSGAHSTMYQNRPGDPIDWRAKLNPRAVVRKLLPPIVLDLRRMLKGPPPRDPEAEGPRTF
jgi:hypothetical protein